MYYNYIFGKIENNIKLEKLGFSIKKLSSKDRENIEQELNYLKKRKQKFDKVLNSYVSSNQLKDNFDEKELKWLSNIISLMVKNNESAMDYNINLTKYLDNLLFIEYDNTLLSKYMLEETIPVFVDKVIGLHNLFDENMLYDKISYKQYSIFSDRKYSHREMGVVYFSLLKGENKENKELDNKIIFFLKQLDIFLSNLDNDNLENFIELVEILYSNSENLQNNIINNVSSIENLLLSNKDSKQYGFILKSGIIMKDNNIEYSNEEISSILSFIYNIRSDIVHGNIKKVKSDYDRLCSKVKDIDSIISKSSLILNHNKEKPYIIASILSNIVLCNVFKYWILYTEKINYLKEN